MILTHDVILDEIARGRIVVDPFDPSQVGPASIDLHLGPEIRVMAGGPAVIELDEDADYRAVTAVRPLEDRYVLQPGETISASHSMPIGQVMFVPREEITFRDGTEEEIAARLRSSQAFVDEKARMKVKTPYGMEYSPHYQRTSRQMKGTAEPRPGEAGGDPTT